MKGAAGGHRKNERKRVMRRLERQRNPERSDPTGERPKKYKENMTQAERRFYLISELLKENDGEAGKYLSLVPGNDGGFVIPEGKKEQEDLLRALMNIRAPYAVSEDFLKVQDEYLQERNKERGITDLEDLQPVNNGSLYLWKGDITTLKIDGIVNAANSALLGCFAPLHYCIDNAIHTFAGIQLRLYCNEIMKKQAHEEGTGLCKITPAFNLPSRYVLHTVGPIIRTAAGPRDKVLLASCYKNCLECAAKNGLKSLAFCCISTGVFRFPAKEAAQIAVETVKTWLSENPDASVKKVVFNVFGDRDFEIYEKILGKDITGNS